MELLLPQYRELIARGANPLRDAGFRLAADDTDMVIYTPFEGVNTRARLAIVGMTPGPDQLVDSHFAARLAIIRGESDAAVIASARKKGAFGGSLRKPLTTLLAHFELADILCIADEADLWDEADSLLHATSVIPHAAFRKGKPLSFSRFAEMKKGSPFQQSFETHFLPTLARLPADCRFLALGRFAGEALAWATKAGHITQRQYLGALPHPSGKSGSQVDLFLGKKSLADLKPADPVRNRAARLAADYEQIANGVRTWRAELGMP